MKSANTDDAVSQLRIDTAVVESAEALERVNDADVDVALQKR